jgi:hypothetical protein
MQPPIQEKKFGIPKCRTGTVFFITDDGYLISN